MEILKKYKFNLENEGKLQKDLKEEKLEPGFEKRILREFEDQMKTYDSDLDGV